MEEEVKFSKRYAKKGAYIGLTISIILAPFLLGLLILGGLTSGLLGDDSVTQSILELFFVCLIWEVSPILFFSFTGWAIGKIRDLKK